MLDLSTTSFPVSPAPDAAPFWEAAESDRFVLPRCEPCAAPFWYPRTACPRCGSRAVTWEPADRDGIVHARTVLHSSALAHLKELLPVVTALVDLADGVRMMGLVDTAANAPTSLIGEAVRLEFRRDADARAIPIFVPT